MELKSCKSCWTQKLIMRQFNFEQRITMIRRAALGKLAVTPRGDALPPLTADWPHPRFWCCHNSDKSLYQDNINTSLISTIFPPVHATCTTLYSNTISSIEGEPPCNIHHWFICWEISQFAYITLNGCWPWNLEFHHLALLKTFQCFQNYFRKIWKQIKKVLTQR